MNTALQTKLTFTDYQPYSIFFYTHTHIPVISWLSNSRCCCSWDDILLLSQHPDPPRLYSTICIDINKIHKYIEHTKIKIPQLIYQMLEYWILNLWIIVPYWIICIHNNISYICDWNQS